jgi:hypothetical protein
MKKLFVLMNHNILDSQIKEAKEALNIGEIIILSNEAWANVDPLKNSILSDVAQYKNRLLNESSRGDYLLVQGDFGATYNMVCFAFKHELIPIYATTQRKAYERITEGKIITTREFIHARFRLYEKGD